LWRKLKAAYSTVVISVKKMLRKKTVSEKEKEEI
jgi:hypothetical protein